jgi:hypothetical protein
MLEEVLRINGRVASAHDRKMVAEDSDSGDIQILIYTMAGEL